MKRWLVALLVTLAVIVLVSPGIVGRLAEKRVEENFEFATSETDEVVITTESFERGWFTSEGRHRIELEEGALGVGSGSAPSLIVDTHIDHGLVPLTSMSRESGSLMPGIANAESVLKLDPGDGELIDLPGRIYSNVGLAGETTSRFLLEAGSRKIQEREIEWQGADVTVHTNPATGSLAIEGAIEPWEMRGESGGIKFGGATVEASQDRTRYGFGVGSGQLDVGPVEIESRPIFGKLSLIANSAIDGDRVDAASNVTLSDVTTPSLGEIDMAMNIAFNGLDAQSSHNIARAFRSAQGAAAPEDAFAQMYPLIEADLQKLLAAGLEIRIDQLDFSLPDGDVTTKLRFDLPQSDTDSEFSWPGLLLALNATVDIRLPVGLFEMARAMNPEAGALVAMGFLQKDGDYYQMQAEYAKGLLTVNGAPMPIPLGGM